MSSSAALAAEQVSKAFGDALALKSVNFTCNAGEVHALLGENGAGKSKYFSDATTDSTGLPFADCVSQINADPKAIATCSTGFH